MKTFGPTPAMFRREGDALLPRKRALTKLECQRVLAVPGAKVDFDTGETTGQDHALWAVARTFGCEGMDGTLPPFSTKEPIRKQLAPFQKAGALFLSEHAEDGALCHDDMGLGKTVQAIAAAGMYPWVRNSKLVLCPAFLRSQWVGEIRKWVKTFEEKAPPIYTLLPGNRVSVEGVPGTVELKSCAPAEGSWVVAYYHDAEDAMKLAIDASSEGYLLIFDEAHNLRGYKTERTESVHAASTFAAGRIALTGDLLVNDAAKLHPVLDLIQPGAFAGYKVFARRYASGTENEEGYFTAGKLSNEDELRGRLKHFAYRRTWDDIPSAERPFETKMQTIWVDVPKGHRAMASMLVKGVQLMSYAHALADAKMEATLNILRNDALAGIPSLTFTLTKKHATELVEALRDKNVQPLLIHSEVKGGDSKKRLSTIEQYVLRERASKRVPMVVATLQSLKEGANLQWAKCVNFAALAYAPDEMRQGLARAARMGNSGTITVRFFVAKGTGDQYFVDLMKHKLTEQMALAGKKESAKSQLEAALSFTRQDIDTVLQRMLEAAKRKEKDEDA